MNITFLIGNGFDKNLGLKTTYADFIKYYQTTDAKSKVLENFRKYIKDNEELWCDAEIALGQFTKEFEKGDGKSFTKCHQDFCEKLVQYLQKEESRLSFNLFKEKILSAFKNITDIDKSFPTQERNSIRTIFNNYRNEPYIFNFICFNYTSTLDKCLEIVKDSKGLLGQHRYNTTICNHLIENYCHVHGTVEKEIVFAVHDETQIAKPDIFDFKYGNICKNFLIKQQANASYQEDTDNKANSILQNSTIIYIYGMSLGQTDTLWWNRICIWLNKSEYHHLIIHNYDMPSKGVYQANYQIAERMKKDELLSFSNYDDNIKEKIIKRIHVTNNNIFSEISNVADKKDLTIQQVVEKIDNITQDKKKAI